MKAEEPSLLSRKFFDEMRAADGTVRHAYAALRRPARQSLDRFPGHQAERRGGAVPAARHHLRRLCRRRFDRAADPLRPDPAHPRPLRMGPGRAGLHPAGEGDQRLSLRHLSRPGDHQGGAGAGGVRAAQPGLPPGDAGRRAAEERLRAYRRHRPDPHRRTRLLRARGQCAHALRHFLRAREPRDHDAAVSRRLRRTVDFAGRQLPRAAVWRICARWRPLAPRTRSSCC